MLVTLDDDNRFFRNGSVYVEDNVIVDVGDIDAASYSPERIVDAGGRLVMPGLIIAHHHLYSTFARGFTPPGEPARNFDENLRKLWWRLDSALDIEDVYYSALLALMNSAHAGCTTIVDHHASPSCRDGSLDEIERALRDVGLSGCLCYEVSDRNRDGEGIAENERFLRKCQAADDNQVTALFGLHASMTLSDSTLEQCAEIGNDLGAGFHVHAAEDEIDVRLTHERHGKHVIERFHQLGITGHKTIFVHGTHLGSTELDLLHATDSMLVCNPESNMNNGLPVPPILDFLGHDILVGVGTDGMSSHPISQARAMYLHLRNKHLNPTLAFVEACEILLENNRTICSRLFDEPRGALTTGQLADIVIHDYVPFTPANAATFYGHLLFGLGFTRAWTTVARGKVIVDEGRIMHLDEAAIRASCSDRAATIWSRIK
jgi:putative selenium metabolism protein SsnA